MTPYNYHCYLNIITSVHNRPTLQKTTSSSKMNPTDKVAIVTGAISGIGLSCVEELLKNNVKVSIAKCVSIIIFSEFEMFIVKYNKRNLNSI